jgi:glycerophosphoryl diester phosphodiesterase
MQIFAHRGVANKGIDENSLEAFQNAVRLGIDGIELDIRLTSDGKPVIVHDPNLRRIAGDNRRIEQVPLRELQSVTLRHGSTIPTLDEVTACVPAPITIDFEVKDARVLDLVIRKLKTSKGLRERTLISSFKPGVIEGSLRDLPEVPRMLLVKRWPVRTRRFAAWIGSNGCWIAQISTALSESRMAWLRRQGIRLATWEPYGLKSNRRRARRFEDLGIEIAIVNQPHLYRDGL